MFVAPVARFVPNGRMVDPEVSSFYVSWQNYDDERQQAELIEDAGEIVGAEAAIMWGRARCDRVLVRLGHVDETHFSAGRITLHELADGGGRPYPIWPPGSPPAEGWWTPSDEAEAESQRMQASQSSDLQGLEPKVPDDARGPWTRLRSE